MPITRVKLRTAIAEYLDEDATFRRYALSTRRSYRRTLDILNRTVPSQAMAYEAKAEWFDRALKTLENGASPEENAARDRMGFSPKGGRSEGALANDMKAMRQFVKFLWRREYLSYARNPVAHLKSDHRLRRTKVPIEKLVVQPSEDVFVKLLDVAGSRHPRDRMTIALGAYAAFRESELKSLRVENIHLDKTVIEDGVTVPAPEIVVWRQKQQEWFRQPMPEQLVAEVRAYFKWFEEVHGPLQPHWFVLATRMAGLKNTVRAGGRIPGAGRLTPLTPLDPERQPVTLAPDIKKAFEAAGYPDLYRLGAHTIRRMAAIHIENTSGDHTAAQDLLGHQKRNDTDTYLQKADRVTRLRGSMRKLPPRKGDDVPSNVIQFRPRAVAS